MPWTSVSRIGWESLRSGKKASDSLIRTFDDSRPGLLLQAIAPCVRALRTLAWWLADLLDLALQRSRLLSNGFPSTFLIPTVRTPDPRISHSRRRTSRKISADLARLFIRRSS